MIDLSYALHFDGAPENWAPLEPVVGCHPVEQPGVVLFRDWVLNHAGGADWGIVRGCDVGGPSKHHEGRAWDWGFARQRDAERVWEQLAADDYALARRAGLRTMIYAYRGRPTIWIAGSEPAPYYGPSPHRDHVHFGFGWEGALGATSLYEQINAPVVQKSPPTVPSAATLPDLPGLSSTPSRFRRGLVAVALDLEIAPDHLAAVIGFETAGSFSGRARNPYSGALGLIQWLPATLRAAHGLSMRQLESMGELAQLDLVGDWYRKVGAVGVETVRDAYLAVFAPAFVGSAPGARIYADPSKAYAQNWRLDRDRDGIITATEAASGVEALLAAARNRNRIGVD